MNRLEIIQDEWERQLVAMVIFHGLKLLPEDLTDEDILEQLKWIRKCWTRLKIKSSLIGAIKYGMRDVWPFSEDGRPWDAKDLHSNLLKAVSSSGAARRRGEVPFNAQTGEVDL
jgi:hypothetical protein